MIENYITYLKFLDEKIQRFFEKQKPYIFCKRGCGKCCKNAHFPYTKIEMNYLVNGFWNLPQETKDIVTGNILKILEDRKNFTGEKFRYDCPFLVNNECCVYEYRGILCRSFGLLTVGSDQKVKIPFCWEEGLNYSNVVEDDGKHISEEKFKNMNIEEQPTAYNISYDFLIDPDFARGFGFEFGEKKPLIEWFVKNEN